MAAPTFHYGPTMYPGTADWEVHTFGHAAGCLCVHCLEMPYVEWLKRYDKQVPQSPKPVTVHAKDSEAPASDEHQTKLSWGPEWHEIPGAQVQFSKPLSWDDPNSKPLDDVVHWASTYYDADIEAAAMIKYKELTENGLNTHWKTVAQELAENAKPKAKKKKSKSKEKASDLHVSDETTGTPLYVNGLNSNLHWGSPKMFPVEYKTPPPLDTIDLFIAAKEKIQQHLQGL